MRSRLTLNMHIRNLIHLLFLHKLRLVILLYIDTPLLLFKILMLLNFLYLLLMMLTFMILRKRLIHNLDSYKHPLVAVVIATDVFGFSFTD